MTGNGAGPSEDVQLDFSKGYTWSRWNVTILQQIYNLILATCQKHGGWGLPNIYEGYLMGQLRGQLKRLQEPWALVQPRFLAEIGAMETSAQVAECVEAYYKKQMSDVGGRTLKK
jgi:hypothetical protein